MTVLPNGPKGAIALFGLASVGLLLMPTRVGYQDIASLLAQQPSVSARWQQHVLSRPFGTIHAAAFNFPQPLGALIPESLTAQLTNVSLRDAVDAPERSGRFQLATLNGSRREAIQSPTGAARAQRGSALRPDIVFPAVNRSSKGDFLGARSSQAPFVPPRSLDPLEAAVRELPIPAYDVTLSLEANGDLADMDAKPDTEIRLAETPAFPDELTDETRTSHLLFSQRPLTTGVGAIEPWREGEEPILLDPLDPEMKRSAQSRLASLGSPSDAMDDNEDAGESLANKGEVTGDAKRPKNPAERLGLSEAARAKAEKCLARAVYFEARGEPERGQVAVAQVIMNRVFSGYYPGDVCGVVYQNAHRHLACQFTFACDKVRDVVRDNEAWERATRIAAGTLDGKLWLPDVGKSTHYHATYVQPSWARSMRKLSKIGIHMFYRPVKWGNGDAAPSWGSAEAASGSAKNL